MLGRRKLLAGLLGAPLVVRDYSVLMPVRKLILPSETGWRDIGRFMIEFRLVDAKWVEGTPIPVRSISASELFA